MFVSALSGASPLHYTPLPVFYLLVWWDPENKRKGKWLVGKSRGTKSKHRYMYLKKMLFRKRPECKHFLFRAQLCRNIATTLGEVSFPAAGGSVFVHIMIRNTTNVVLESCKEPLEFSVHFFSIWKKQFPRRKSQSAFLLHFFEDLPKLHKENVLVPPVGNNME